MQISEGGCYCGAVRYRAGEPPSNSMICHCRSCRLDDPERFAPTHHSWLSHDLAWVRFGDGLPPLQEWRKD